MSFKLKEMKNNPNKYLWGIRKGQKSRKIQNFNLMTPYVSGVIDNNLRSS